MCNYQPPEGITIKPDGIHEIDPCDYEVEGVYSNVIVEVLKCKKCGKYSIGWYRTPETEELDTIEWDKRG